MVCRESPAGDLLGSSTIFESFPMADVQQTQQDHVISQPRGWLLAKLLNAFCVLEETRLRTATRDV